MTKFKIKYDNPCDGVTEEKEVLADGFHTDHDAVTFTVGKYDRDTNSLPEAISYYRYVLSVEKISD